MKLHCKEKLEWNVEEFGGFFLDTLSAPIVAGGGLDVGMPGHLLHGGDVRAGIEQISDERPPQIVRGERGKARLARAFS